MAIVGVTHCSSCKAVVNAHWQVCLACSMPLKKSAESFAAGMTVQYRTPIIVGHHVQEWKHHRGTIQLVDTRWEMAFIVPRSEEEQWIWIPFIYCEPVHDE